MSLGLGEGGGEVPKKKRKRRKIKNDKKKRIGPQPGRREGGEGRKPRPFLLSPFFQIFGFLHIVYLFLNA